MIEQADDNYSQEKEETFTLLSEIHNSADHTQRDLSVKLNVSLGKVNYLIKELMKRGFISVRSFSTNPEKIKKVRYILTKKGFHARVDLTHYFLKKKEEEYHRMKVEWERVNNLKHVEESVESKEA